MDIKQRKGSKSSICEAESSKCLTSLVLSSSCSSTLLPAVTHTLIHTPNYPRSNVNECVFASVNVCACVSVCYSVNYVCVAFLTFFSRAAKYPKSTDLWPLTPATFHTSPWKRSWNTVYWLTSSLLNTRVRLHKTKPTDSVCCKQCDVHNMISLSIYDVFYIHIFTFYDFCHFQTGFLYIKWFCWC